MWTLLEDDHDVQVFVGQDPTAPPRVINYISSTQVHATIDEVARLFHTETPHEYATYRRNFAKDIIDGALLYTLAQSSEANPRHFLGVRWMVVGSPVPAVIKHRDFCSIEGRYDFDLNGKRGWLRCFKSIELAACPDLEPTLGLVRGRYHRVGFVFVESDRPGVLQVTQLMQLYTGGHLPSWLQRFSAKRRARSIEHIEMFVRQNRMALMIFSDAILVDKTSRRRCFLCQHKFGPFRMKWSCQQCGEVVCKSCCRILTEHVGSSTSGRQEPTRVCTTCLFGSGPSYRQALFWPSSSTPQHASSSCADFEPSNPRLALFDREVDEFRQDQTPNNTLGRQQQQHPTRWPVERPFTTRQDPQNIITSKRLYDLQGTGDNMASYAMYGQGHPLYIQPANHWDYYHSYPSPLPRYNYDHDKRCSYDQSMYERPGSLGSLPMDGGCPQPPTLVSLPVKSDGGRRNDLILLRKPVPAPVAKA
ncbi:hypothetical protein, variant [Aphanomyces astaci]|nr:hypothetical protein, variant [Aphanomyces astaci]ETV66596.1 hypothetical protein, variant [Aphanomyces astaci]|eukprot:XP_009843967.1 hypothetical protein, variant [Aphanomyces astaci]